MKKEKKESRIELTKIILAFIAVAGAASIIAVAPGVLHILRPFIRGKRRYQTPTYVEGVIGKLQKRGLLVVYQKHSERVVKLTDKGERELLKYRVKEAMQKKQRWDGKWRMVAFDIREIKRRRRDLIRENIARFGFVKLQGSVWVFPYACEELIALLKAECHIGNELLYVIAEKIENDGWLRKHFILPS